MAELIDRKATRKIIEKYFETLAPSHYYKMDLEKASVYLDAEIAELPTTTESEIRAKAISDFLQFVYDNASKYANEDGWAMSDLIDLEYKFLEQLKEEQ